MTGALSDITVVSFAQLAQGPVATQMLADLGAEVIKIERPGGEWQRNWSMANEFPGGESAVFLSFNRNKRSIELDLKDEEHREAAYELVDDADVVIENFRPGVIERLGFGYEDLSERNPSLVYATASGYGREGPYADRAGQDVIIQGVSGLAALTGRRDDPPTPAGATIVDFYSAANIAFGIMAALWYRERTGVGQKIDTSLLSAALNLEMQEISVYENAGVEPERSEAGIAHVYNQAPYGVYETSNGHLVLSLSPPSEVGEAIDLDAIKGVETWEEAWDRRDEIKRLIETELRKDTTENWLEMLWEHDIWCGPVNDLGAALSHPQVRANDMLWTVDHPTVGELNFAALPLNLSETPPVMSQHPPLSGEHTEEVLQEQGFPQEKIDRILGGVED